MGKERCPGLFRGKYWHWWSSDFCKILKMIKSHELMEGRNGTVFTVICGKGMLIEKVCMGYFKSIPPAE